MLNNNKNGLKTVVGNMGKISSGGIKLVITAMGLATSYQAYLYYKDDAKNRAYEISHSTLDKRYDSVRVKDVELIRQRLTRKPDEIKNTFSVLVGPPGIGKTVAIQSAAENLNGIILFESIVEKKYLSNFQNRPLL